MPGVGRNSYKAAMQKAKELGAKKAGKKIRDAKPQHFMSKSFARIPAEGVNEIKPDGIVKSPMTKTGGGYGITRLNSDRPADSMPSQALNRFNYGFPRMSRNFMESIEQDPNANAGIKKAVAKERAKLDE